MLNFGTKSLSVIGVRKVSKAEIVRECLATEETPRM
jgi:hypothetical protein